MRVVYYPDSSVDEGRFAATIGYFDGVHCGHCHVVRQLRDAAQKRGLCSMVITFDQHPRQVFQSEWQPQQLTTLHEKVSLLAQTGIDMLVVLRFSKAMSLLPSWQFMDQVLKRDLHVDLLLTGYDNRFGHDRSSTFNDYVAYGRDLQMEVIGSDAIDVDGMRVSSSLVRRLIGQGEVSQAARCLGRCYDVAGRVVHGEQIGRQLGFPTANIVLDDSFRLLPANGVYAVFVKIDEAGCASSGSFIVEGATSEIFYQGMMNIGTRPTFDGHQQTLEINIFDFNGDIYGCHLQVMFVERLRNEHHFNTRTELVCQMQGDALRARKVLCDYLNDSSDV